MKSRTTNVIMNFISSIGGQLLGVVLQFVVRTVFIQTLGKPYLGINGLFTSILSMLALADLGVGSAIIYKLYDPLANNDKHRITLLIQFYKRVYRYIGLTIAILGACLIPFLPRLIKDYDNLEALHLSAVLIYCLHLFRTVSSYLFWAYKASIISADQKEYIQNVIGYILSIVSAFIQIICMWLFKSFVLYVIILVTESIIHNLISAVISNRFYPYINDKTNERLSKEETKGIFKDCTALFIYKVNGVVLMSTGNIVLAAYLGLDSVALYSNYLIFYTTVRNLFSKIYNAVSHSLGNLHTTNNLKHEYDVFESTMLVTAIMGGTSFVGIAVVADELIEVWIGKDWVIEKPFSFLMGLEVFTVAFNFMLSKYRSIMGLFQQAKYRPVAGMIINVILSVALIRSCGISSVLIGTIASIWLTTAWYDPLVIHRIGFQNQFPIWGYYKKYLNYFIVSLVCFTFCFFVCRHFFSGHGWTSVMIHAFICGLITPIVLVFSVHKGKEAAFVTTLAQNEINIIKEKLLRTH